jgi:hypothetical protein
MHLFSLSCLSLLFVSVLAGEMADVRVEIKEAAAGNARVTGSFKYDAMVTLR